MDDGASDGEYVGADNGADLCAADGVAEGAYDGGDVGADDGADDGAGDDEYDGADNGADAGSADGEDDDFGNGVTDGEVDGSGEDPDQKLLPVPSSWVSSLSLSSLPSSLSCRLRPYVGANLLVLWPSLLARRRLSSLHCKLSLPNRAQSSKMPVPEVASAVVTPVPAVVGTAVVVMPVPAVVGMAVAVPVRVGTAEITTVGASVVT